MGESVYTRHQTQILLSRFITNCFVIRKKMTIFALKKCFSLSLLAYKSIFFLNLHQKVQLRNTIKP